MLRKLMHDHAIMRERAERLLRLLDSPVMPPSEQIADARWHVSSHIMQHLAFEDRHLYSKLLRDERPDVVETGLRFQAQLATLFASFSESAQRWTPEAIAQDWNGFRKAARGMIGQMFARIDSEERELFPFVSDADIELKEKAAPSTNWARDAFAIKDAILSGLQQEAPAGQPAANG